MICVFVDVWRLRVSPGRAAELEAIEIMFRSLSQNDDEGVMVLLMEIYDVPKKL
jgi:hypothetical protein